jgi:hypothetical protein
MTDPQQIHSNPISVKRVAITLLATAIIGAIAGLAAWSQLLTNSQAVAIASIGKYSSGGAIEEPQSFIERIKTPDFASAVSVRAGVPELAVLLPAGQFGGSGAITARSLRDPNLIEIRVSLQQPDIALKAVAAAIDELIADHEARVAPIIENLRSSVAVLDKHASEIVKTSDTIIKRTGGSSQTEETGQDSTALLSAFALTQSGLSALISNEASLRNLLSDVRRTQVIATPTVTTPKAASLYRIVAAGIVAGLLVGLLSLQMFSGFFRPG